MPTRSNKHIRKYNQLVEVYDPSGIEQMETVKSRETSRLEERKEETIERREKVEALTTGDFFDEERQTEMHESETLPAPEEAADSQREDMLDRLDAIEEALTDAIEADETLDSDDELGF